MSKCPKCGAEVSANAKFCEECGAKIIKKEKQLTGVSIGDKNVIAGDVSITHVNAQDETKLVNTCHCCGKQFYNGEGYTCPVCGEFTCIDDYDADKKMCVHCAKASEDSSKQIYKETCQKIFAKGAISREDRNTLDALANKINLSKKDAGEIEKEFKYQEDIDLTDADKITLNKINDNLLYGKENAAWDKIQDLYKLYSNNKDVFKAYIRTRAKIENAEFENTLKKFDFDSKTALLALVEIKLRNRDLSAVNRLIETAKKKWPKDDVITCYEIILYCNFANKNEDREKYLAKAQNLLNNISISSDIDEFEKNLYNTATMLYQWVISANENIDNLNIKPYWKSFIKDAFDYSAEYLAQQEKVRIEQSKKAKAAEEERRRMESEKFWEEMNLKAKEENRQRAEKILLICKKIGKEIDSSEVESWNLQQKKDELEKLEVLEKLADTGIKTGSFKDERDGNEYNTFTIGSQTWMAEPLRYKESQGICSLGEGIRMKDDHYSYEWAAAKGLSSYNLKFPIKIGFSAFIISLLSCLLISFGITWLFNWFFEMHSIIGYLCFWGIPLITCFLFTASNFGDTSDSLEKIPHAIVILIDIIILVVLISSSIFYDEYFWTIWLCALGIVSIITSVFATKIYCSSKRTFRYSPTSIAPKGYRLPVGKDLSVLMTNLKKTHQNQKERIVKDLSSLYPTNIFKSNFWLDEVSKKYSIDISGNKKYTIYPHRAFGYNTEKRFVCGPDDFYKRNEPQFVFCIKE